MKLLKTILLSVTFLSSILLWITRDEYLPSLSAFALSDNAVWYRIMHLSASWFFLINAIEFKKYATEYILALGMGLILAFDMYHHTTIHNVVTVFTLVLASFTLLVNAETTFKKGIALIFVIGALGSFALGYFWTGFHFLMAEIIAMTFLSSGKLTEIYSVKNK